MPYREVPLIYNPETGHFHRPTYKRERSGHLAKNGYITIRHNNKVYLAHRLAFLFMTGSLPKYQIDHINGIRSDNRWCNLREATPAQNSINRGNVKGVCSRTRKGRPGIWYSAYIEKDGKTYSTTKRKEEDAKNWRKQKEIELFGEFRREVV